MSQPFIGEIKMFGGNFAPVGYAFCNGALMAISENDALFSLIGTTYGGDGQNTFGLPDLRGRIPVHQGNLSGTTFTIGEQTGSEEVTLTSAQIPSHSHSLGCNNANGTESSPSNNVVAATQKNFFSATAPDSQMGNSIQPFNSGNQPHDNMMPYLCINFIISLYGIYPSQN